MAVLSGLDGSVRISAFSKSFLGHSAVPAGWANPGSIHQQLVKPLGDLGQAGALALAVLTAAQLLAQLFGSVTGHRQPDQAAQRRPAVAVAP
jgi:hypothetical protein